MYNELPLKFNLNYSGEITKRVSVPVKELFTYPPHISLLSRRRYSLTSPLVKYN